MTKFKEKDRVYLPGSTQFGTVTNVVEKADGPWAEQFYEVKLDDNDLFEVTLGEYALVPENEAPDWSVDDLPEDHPIVEQNA